MHTYLYINIFIYTLLVIFPSKSTIESPWFIYLQGLLLPVVDSTNAMSQEPQMQETPTVNAESEKVLLGRGECFAKIEIECGSSCIHHGNIKNPSYIYTSLIYTYII